MKTESHKVDSAADEPKISDPMVAVTHRAISQLHFFGRRLLRPEGFHALDSLLVTQWWSSEQIRELQETRLRELCIHSYQHTAYYRKAMDEAGIDPKTITVDRLRLLPVLEKPFIQHHLSNLTASAGVDEPQRTILNATGGSTGEPLRLYQDFAYQFNGWAELWRDYVMCGYRFGDPHAFVWGSDYDSRRHGTPLGDLRDYLQNVLWLNAFNVTEASLTRFASRLTRFQPRLLIGYVSSLTLLARAAQASGITGIKPTAVQTSAETLTPPQRALIEEVFQTKAFDRYGCREVGNIAHECEAHSGLHLLCENNLIEVTDSSGKPVPASQPGYVVVTNLINKATPLIRYRIGDVATLTDRACSCGRGLPLMESVHGRSADIITAPNGKLIHGEFFTHLFYKFKDVRQFRVEQESSTALKVQISPTKEFDSNTLVELEHLIHTYADPQFDVRFELLDNIPPASSGKFRFTVSRVPLRFGDREHSPSHH